jgi:alkanesulfonate monooxygenase SsuD/methylene tetrahydromethanopterin reductase-like flavin-dependent oxidoreductase (luciferase family)
LPMPRWEDQERIALDAEELGFDSLWLVDHFLWRSDPWERNASAELGVWECWTSLAALAAATRRISIGTLVTCTAYRHPALLAKMADTVDEISGGRLVLGLGAGDYEPEHQMLGQAFDRRIARFEEALNIIKPLLRSGEVDCEGEFYSARDFRLRPRGPRPAGPPILIGALAHRPRMLRLVAQHADIWNVWAAGSYGAEDIGALRDAVDMACRQHGRDPASLRRTAMVAVAFSGPMVNRHAVITGGHEEIARSLGAFSDEGIDELQVGLFPMTRESVAELGQVVQSLRA